MAEVEDQINLERKRGYFCVYNWAGRRGLGNYSLITLLISTDSQTDVAETHIILTFNKRESDSNLHVLTQKTVSFLLGAFRTNVKKNTELRKMYFTSVAPSCETWP